MIFILLLRKIYLLYFYYIFHVSKNKNKRIIRDFNYPNFKHLNLIGGTKLTNQNETKKKGSVKLDLTSIVIIIFKIK